MAFILHRSDSRGYANFGWLKSFHTFSFGNYYNPERMHFGALRVLNDDCIAGGTGFGQHPHDNMEIISIPLQGELSHSDNMGNSGVIREGDVQIMSAGKGIVHSEMNHLNDEETRFLQIWVIPNQRNVTPRYDQLTINNSKESNNWVEIIAPQAVTSSLWIHQNTWMYLGSFHANQVVKYLKKVEGNGVYIFLIEGEVMVHGEHLNKRDAIGITDEESIEINMVSETRIFVMEVPMSV